MSHLNRPNRELTASLPFMYGGSMPASDSEPPDVSQLGRRTWGNLTLHKAGIGVHDPSVRLLILHDLRVFNSQSLQRFPIKPIAISVRIVRRKEANDQAATSTPNLLLLGTMPPLSPFSPCLSSQLPVEKYAHNLAFVWNPIAEI